jgi:hypothetical protein
MSLLISSAHLVGVLSTCGLVLPLAFLPVGEALDFALLSKFTLHIFALVDIAQACYSFSFIQFLLHQPLVHSLHALFKLRLFGLGNL